MISYKFKRKLATSSKIALVQMVVPIVEFLKTTVKYYIL